MYVRTEYKPNQYWGDKYPHKVVYKWAEPRTDWDGTQVRVEFATSVSVVGEKTPVDLSWGKALTEKGLRDRAQYYKTALVSWVTFKPRRMK